MTVPANNPVVQQRRLRAELRKAREQAKLTQAQVADAMDWSVSKVIRIETGSVGLSTVDLRALLQLYGNEDRAVVEELVKVAKASRRRAWWDAFKDFLGEAMVKFIGLEASASLVRQYQERFLPGLLQTTRYAQAILAVHGTDAEVATKKAEARHKRQEIINEDSVTKFFFVIEEGVLRRMVGGKEVMREQLDKLKVLNRLPNVSIRILPFSAGEHIGMTHGAFTVFEFPGEEQDHVVVLERPDLPLEIKDAADSISGYLESFVSLEEVATPPEELDDFIDRLIREMD